MLGPIDRQPDRHIFWDDRAPWVRVGDDLPRFGSFRSGVRGAQPGASRRVNFCDCSMPFAT